MPTPYPSSAPAGLRRLALAAAAACALGTGLPAWAENHALIMWIGDYGDPRANLPGIDLDAANARVIATAMGVPAQNITEISNAQLTAANMAAGFVSLHKRINDGDKVFIYYSGHGGQLPAQGTSARCTEALVARDALFLDKDMQTVLTALGEKASQVVMMNDSCFSGGAATKSITMPPVEPGFAPKFMPAGVKTNTAVTDGYACGDPTNTTKMARSLGAMAKEARGPQVLYIAASNDTQVSFATPKGSLATLAWAACMGAAQADTDRSGRINGEELAACAQGLIDRRRTKQTITLQGNTKLPLSFVTTADAAPAAAATTATAEAAPAPAPSATAPVNAAQALQDLRAGADRSYQVNLNLARNSLRIGKDLLDFTVSSDRQGYVYLLQVGSDGKTFNLLFPNKIDDNNFIASGTHRFPRETWRVRAAGPVGASHLLAIVSPTKKDLSRSMDLSSVFPSGAANQGVTRTLVVEATGAGAGGDGRYGASEVTTLNETP
jgi:septal ring-binding cell division protein DamX